MSFRETVMDKSDHTVMSKSPNKHNRLYLEARPMEDGLAEVIDEGKVGPRDDPKVGVLGWQRNCSMLDVSKRRIVSNSQFN